MPTCHEPEVCQHVAKKIRVLRRERRLSQTELGSHCGISFQQIQKIESGTNRVSVDALWLISQKLDVPVATFFPGGIKVPGRVRNEIKGAIDKMQNVLEHLP